MSVLVEKFWPNYCRKHRPFLTEDQIVMDLVSKIRGSRSALLWWVLTEQSDLLIYSRKHKDIIVRYYNLSSPRNPHFCDVKESMADVQLRILKRTWKVIHILDEQWNLPLTD